MKNKGFSLVELIVVIAIMAILVGVAVPVYSSYIEKTQIAKDKQLVGEVAHALQIGYAANGGESAPAYVILYPNKGAEANAAAQALLAEIFPNLADLKLAYDGWGDATALSFLGSLNAESANAILGSSFLTGSNATELLGEVSSLTNTAFGFIGKKLGDSTLLYDNMKGNFGSGDMSDEEFNALCEKYGIATKKNDSGEYIFDYSNDTEFQTQLSNFMVMAAAEDFAKAADAAQRDESYSASFASGLVLQYATYNAIANSKYADAATKQAYAVMGEALNSASSVQDVEEAMAAFAENPSVLAVKEQYEADAAQTAKDESAIINIMTTVGNAANIVTPEDIKNPDLYASGAVSNYFNSYIASAGLVVGLGEDVIAELKAKLEANPGAIAIYMANGVIGCTDPSAYLS